MRVTNMMAMSLDGRIGIHDREGDNERLRIGLSSAADQRLLRQQIEKSDAIIVGASSIRANGECLDHPGKGFPTPIWYILAQKEIPAELPFWRQHHIPRVIVSKAPLPIYDSTVQNMTYGDANPAIWLHSKIKQMGLQNVLLFGGGIINQLFYNSELVDELKLTISPIIIGKESASHFVAPPLATSVKLCLLSSHTDESFVFLNYAIIKTYE